MKKIILHLYLCKIINILKYAACVFLMIPDLQSSSNIKIQISQKHQNVSYQLLPATRRYIRTCLLENMVKKAELEKPEFF